MLTQVLILVCVEVSVGDKEEHSQRLNPLYVLILVCVEVSVGAINNGAVTRKGSKS